jgi:hypothetical protein
MFIRTVSDLLLYSCWSSYTWTLFGLTTVCISQIIKFSYKCCIFVNVKKFISHPSASQIEKYCSSIICGELRRLDSYKY